MKAMKVLPSLFRHRDVHPAPNGFNDSERILMRQSKKSV
jgi:hypothetical protein